MEVLLASNGDVHLLGEFLIKWGSAERVQIHIIMVRWGTASMDTAGLP